MIFQSTSRWAAVLFLAGCALYVFSSAPALAPYRDMGEMVSVSKTLGVAHPPGYPAYTLLGKISTLLPTGNPSYRVNLVSVMGGAASACLLFLMLTRLGLITGVAVIVSLAWLGLTGVWTVSIVTEMYAPGLAATMGLLALWAGPEEMPDRRIFCAVFFLAGLAMGLRLDLVLLLPAFAAAWITAAWKENKLGGIFSSGAWAGLWCAAGFSIYFYLMVRSAQHPWLNWNRPETLEKFLGTLMRKTHGGTLDLLSANYEPGALFWTDFSLYLKDAARQFWWVGAPLALIGWDSLRRKRPAFFALTTTGWIFSGPFFLYKANLPPNPHAYAILEAHFLLPNVFVAIWAAFGLNEMILWISHEGQSLRRKVVWCVCVVAVALGITLRWPDLSKRNNFFGWDYGDNLLRTVPPGSLLVMQKDVQLFNFWARQYAMGSRPDVTVVARGLAGSPWYAQMRRESGSDVHFGPLRSDEDWKWFMERNPGRRVFAGLDQDVPASALYAQIPRGALRELVLTGAANQVVSFASFPDVLRETYVYRGRYDYGAQKEFFSSDLIDDYSKGHFARGVEFSKNEPSSALARPEWNRVIALNSENGAAYYRRGFLHFIRNEYRESRVDFESADRIYEKTSRLTGEYFSLPDVVEGVRSEWGDALLNLGVACERMGDREGAERAYQKALNVRPTLARAHYNLAVLYWNRDWRKVVEHLQATLRLEPGNGQARQFLPKALYALQSQSQ